MLASLLDELYEGGRVAYQRHLSAPRLHANATVNAGMPKGHAAQAEGGWDSDSAGSGSESSSGSGGGGSGSGSDSQGSAFHPSDTHGYLRASGIAFPSS